MHNDDFERSCYRDGDDLEKVLSYTDGESFDLNDRYAASTAYEDVTAAFFHDRALEPLRTWEKACEMYRDIACQKGLPTYNPSLGASGGLAHTYVGGQTTTASPGEVVVSPVMLGYGASAIAEVLMHEGYHVMGMGNETHDYFLQYEAPFLAANSGYIM